MIKLRTLLAAALLPLAASCTEFEFAEQEITVRFDAEQDVLEVTLDTRGIYGTPSGDRKTVEAIDEQAAARVRQMAAGYRYFHVLTWPLVFDLDEPQSVTETVEANGALASFAETWKRLAPGITVTEARAYADSNDEVAVFQRVRIAHATELIALLNKGLSVATIDSLQNEKSGLSDAVGDGLFDSPAAHRLLVEHAKAGRDWLSLDEGGFSIHVPMTPRDLALALRQSFDLAGDPTDDAERATAVGRAFFHGLDSIEVDGHVVTFRFPFGSDGRIVMPYETPRHADAPRLRAQFAKGELDE